MTNNRFEIHPEGMTFVQPNSGGERGPLLHTAVPSDAVPGDVLIDQQGSTATMYVYLGAGPDVSAPAARTTDPTDPNTGPARWAPVQAQVGSAHPPTGTIRIWQPDIAYGFPDMVVTGDGAGIGFMLWLCTSPSIPAGSPDPSAPGTTGWTSVGGNTTTFRIYGSVATYDDLPATGSVDGELWYVIDEGSLYTWGTDDQWHNVGYIRGPEGPPGPTGAQGAPGATGPAGPPGPQGPQGDGIELNGSVPTVGDLPADAAPGDAYIVEADGFLYVMGDDGEWHAMETVVGPPGSDGPQGPPGPAGPVTPMVIVEALTPPGTLPPGALYFDLDDTYSGYMNATVVEGTVIPADHPPRALFYDTDATLPSPPPVGALYYKRSDGVVVAVGGAGGGGGAAGDFSDLPVGSIIEYAGGAVRSDFLFCDGSAVSRATYADLFAVIGTTYGAGDGSSTFNIPDRRGRTGVGVGTGVGLTTRALGAKFGAETHLLTAAESGLPAHNHTQNAHNHTQDAHTHPDTPGTARIVVGGTASGTSWNAGTNTNANFFGTPAATATNQPATATNNANAAASAASAHNNVQPSIAMNYLIKAIETNTSLIGPQGPPGATGPTGPAGATGATGATGAQGPKGDTGATGAPGSTGPAGTPGEKWFTGAGAPAGSLATSIVGDWYVDSGNGDYYEKTGASAWTLRGNLRGPQGPTGATGSTGSTGPAGTPGDAWFTGAGAPAGGLAGSIVGDWYLDSSTGDYYEKTGASAWTLRGNLRGPQGPTGATGTAGTNGTNGEKWFSGAGAPAGGLAGSVVGDWYLDSGNGDYYEKTGASAWTLRGNLKGPKGDTGSTGPPGSVPPGTINATVRSTADTGYLFMTGQTITGGQTLYPDLWAVLPASWKSGANIVFPDTRSRMLVGDDAGSAYVLGDYAGFSTVTLTSANLPPHVHAIDHDHASATTSGQSVTHTHSDTPGTARIVVGGSATGVLWNGGTNSNGNFVATPANSVDHTHTLDLPNFTGSSGNGGFANTPVSIPVPLSIVINWQIKT